MYPYTALSLCISTVTNADNFIDFIEFKAFFALMLLCLEGECRWNIVLTLSECSQINF